MLSPIKIQLYLSIPAFTIVSVKCFALGFLIENVSTPDIDANYFDIFK